MLPCQMTERWREEEKEGGLGREGGKEKKERWVMGKKEKMGGIERSD